mmetsp:Transcript_1572/g.4435  ORF Transcript_1572/g.4435 Transcript_1572/m.4435 type:complete len:487 (-) Transcript_1572:249-1709(-)
MLTRVVLLGGTVALSVAAAWLARRRLPPIPGALLLATKSSASQLPQPQPPPAGFHRRPLPAPSIALSSRRGRELFREALDTGGLDAFFRLSECFQTQAEPSFCGLGTLVNALNALEVDPGVLWKGVWRWYSEEQLDCCVDLVEVEKRGMTFDEWICLARCQGLDVRAARADTTTIEAFRDDVAACCASTEAILCVSYTRKVLKQTGDGHFSPIGGYHSDRDLVLILDVARFKHPPHWVPLTTLWEAMVPLDQTTARCRGYALLARPGNLKLATATTNPSRGPRLVRRPLLLLTFGRRRLEAASRYFSETVPVLSASCASTAEEMWLAIRHLTPAAASWVAIKLEDECHGDGQGGEVVGPLGPAAAQAHDRAALDALRASAAYELLAAEGRASTPRDGPAPVTMDAAAALLLLVADSLLDAATLQRAFPRAAGILLNSAAQAPEDLRDELDAAAQRLALMRLPSAACCAESGSAQPRTSCQVENTRA